jgi:homoserine O-acetyltransferase
MTRRIVTVPEFTLENGVTLRDVPVAYRAWGRLSARADNAVLVCHALTGDTNAAQWWSELFGPGRALDTERDYIVCANVIGSPYGTVSPLTIDTATGESYGAAFPAFTIRDSVALHKLLLDALGVQQVRFAIGGSMGGMQVLEWAFYRDFVRGLVPIGVGGRHSAWCIAWSWAQRRAIELDPSFEGGDYVVGEGPKAGLGLARMIAMITYRSFSSFQGRFGRARTEEPLFDMASYLMHQGDKLVDRFDANCYLALMSAMDTHDVARDRGDYDKVLAGIDQPTLAIGIDSDVLYPPAEQRELAQYLPKAELAILDAGHGHDSFLIERNDVNQLVKSWRDRVLEPISMEAK